MADSRGFAFMLIAGSAIRSCCHGLGPTAAHPARSASPPEYSRIRSMRWRLGKQALNLLFIFFLALVGEADVLIANVSGAVDEHRTRHSDDPERRGDIALGVEDDGEFRRSVLQEFLSQWMRLVDVHANDDQVATRVLVRKAIQPGKGASAGRTPGCPEVEIHDLAPVGAQVQAPSLRAAAGHRKTEHTKPFPHRSHPRHRQILVRSAYDILCTAKFTSALILCGAKLIAMARRVPMAHTGCD